MVEVKIGKNMISFCHKVPPHDVETIIKTAEGVDSRDIYFVEDGKKEKKYEEGQEL